MNEKHHLLAKFSYKIFIYIHQGQKACNLNTGTSEMILGVPSFYIWRKDLQKAFVSGFLPC